MLPGILPNKIRVLYFIEFYYNILYESNYLFFNFCIVSDYNLIDNPC